MKRIAVFDSGVGGLSIARHLSTKLSSSKIDFISDRANYPYGTKTEEKVIESIETTVAQYLENKNPDVCVIACNTASTVALNSLRRKFDVEFVGVVPAIKPACLMSRTKEVCLLATPGTVKRNYTKKLIEDFSNGSTVHLIGSSRLVELAEMKLSGQNINLEELDEIVQEINSFGNVDIVVLGCTHFPLLVDELKVLGGEKFLWVDSTEAITSRVSELIGVSGRSITDVVSPIDFFTTSSPEIFGEFVFNSLIQ